MDDTQIARINHLARKSKSVGLTDDERVEQQALRREYIDKVKASLKCALDSIEVVD